MNNELGQQRREERGRGGGLVETGWVVGGVECRVGTGEGDRSGAEGRGECTTHSGRDTQMDYIDENSRDNDPHGTTFV